MPPWYHGEIGRDQAETKLVDASGKFRNGEVIFLVRKSGSSPKVGVCGVVCVG